MLNRLTVSLALALLGVFAATAPAFAADNPDKEEIAIGTFLIAVGVMFVLFLAYAIRRAFGLDKMPPDTAEPGEPHH